MTNTLVRKQEEADATLCPLELQPLETVTVLDDEKAWGILVGIIIVVCGGL